MILALQGDDIEAELWSGSLSCSCAGRLRPWSHARVRLIRQRDGSEVELRPRRAICVACRRTHVLLPAISLPRRRDAIETVGDALLAAAAGRGHRKIAAELALPASTVRNWLRRAHRGAEWLRQRATRAAYELDPGLPPFPVRSSPLEGALDALGSAAAAAIRRFGWIATSPWSLVAIVSGGRLLTAPPDG